MYILSRYLFSIKEFECGTAKNTSLNIHIVCMQTSFRRCRSYMQECDVPSNEIRRTLAASLTQNISNHIRYEYELWQRLEIRRNYYYYFCHEFVVCVSKWEYKSCAHNFPCVICNVQKFIGILCAKRSHNACHLTCNMPHIVRLHSLLQLCNVHSVVISFEAWSIQIYISGKSESGDCVTNFHGILWDLWRSNRNS